MRWIQFTQKEIIELKRAIDLYDQFKKDRKEDSEEFNKVVQKIKGGTVYENNNRKKSGEVFSKRVH